jgi:GNAT superfamily N-acetyltransferase
MTIIIRSFESQADVLFAESLTQKENWRSETAQEIKTFYEYDPVGCLIAQQNGHPVGICITTAYKNNGFIGELIVSPSARRSGIGQQLMITAIQYLQNKGIRQIFLDAVLKAVPLYESLGFEKITRSLRFFGQVPAQLSPNIFPITLKELPAILEIDQNVFGENRGFFLKQRIQNYPHLNYYRKNNQGIQSYLFGRQGRGGWVTIGPWVNLQTEEKGLPLLHHFQYQIGNQPFSMGVLATNQPAIQIIVRNGLMPQPDPPIRMALHTQENLGSSHQNYAIGSPAKG